MRAIQNYRITFKSDVFEFFDLLKNKDAIYNMLEYTARHAAVNFEDTAKVEAVTFLESNLMQVVVELPYAKNYEITDTLRNIADDIERLPYCADVLLTDDDPEL